MTKALEEIAALEASLAITLDHRAEFLCACNFAGDSRDGLRQLERESRRLHAGLPFYAFRKTVVQTVRDHNIAIIIGETGSGKSTQIAPFLLDSSLCDEQPFLKDGGKIVVTQPRSLAANELAARVSSEWGSISQGRFAPIGTQPLGPPTQRIAYTTDSKLLNIVNQNPSLAGIDCVVVDEVHERSISTDLLLGCLKGVLARRPDLHVVLTSATMDRSVFQAFYRDVCLKKGESAPVPVIEVPGRTFPVDDHYDEAEDDFVAFAWRKALSVHRDQPPGDIIVFLATIVDIERACSALKSALGIDESCHEGSNALVLPLHGKLQAEESQRAFLPPPNGKRKILFSTSIAETSVTIDGVVYVIDSGMANVAGYDQVRNMTFLDVRYITKSSVKQRRGRAGRTRPGVCYHLYSEEQYAEFEETQVPEIRRSNLTQTVLKLTALFGAAGGSVHDFEFIERPSAEALDEALRTLDELEAIRSVAQTSSYVLTDCGRQMLKLDQPPEVCRMILYGTERGIQSDVVALAGLLVAGSYVFYRSGSDEAKRDADLHKAAFCQQEDDGSFGGDWFAMLNVFREWVVNGKSAQWSRSRYVVQKTLKLAEKISTGIAETLVNLHVARDDLLDLPTAERLRLLKASICAGFFKSVSLAIGGQRGAGMKVARLEDRTAQLHPSSVLAMVDSKPQCVIYEELVRTSRYYIRGVTAVDVETVIAVSPRFSERIRLRDLSERRYVACEFVDIGPAVRARIVGPRGCNLQQLESTLNATIDMEPGSSAVRLWAPEASIEVARQGFEHFISDAKQAIRSETVEVALAGFHIRTVVSSGCATSMILERNEFRKAILRGLPANFPWVRGSELLSRISGLPSTALLDVTCLAVSSDGLTSWGFAVCSDPVACADLVHRIDKTSPSAPEFAGCEISAHPSCEVQESAPIVRDCGVKAVWNTYLSTGKFLIDFSSEAYAELAEGELLHVALTLRGRRAILRKREGTKIYFGNAEVTVDEEYILRTLAAGHSSVQGVKSVSVLRKPPASKEKLDHDVSLFTSIFTSCGEVLSVNIFPFDERNGKGKAYILFADRMGAQRAVQELNGREGLFSLSHCVLRLSADISCVYRIPSFVYPVIRGLLTTEKERVEAVNAGSGSGGNAVRISGPVEKGLKGATIKLETSSLHVLGAAKVGFDRIIAGRQVALADPSDVAALLRCREGKLFLQRLNDGTVCVQVNNNTSSIRLYGPDDATGAAHAKISLFVADMKNSSGTVLNLPGAALHGLVGEHARGLESIEAESGASSVDINWYRSSVTILGTEEARSTAERIIRARIQTLEAERASRLASAVEAKAAGGSSSVAVNTQDCQLCYTEPEDYALEACGHRCCRGCLRRMLGMFSRPDTEIHFPIKCPIDPQCGEPVSLADIRQFMDRTSFEAMCRESAKQYIDHSPDHRFCFSANCNGVLPDGEAKRGFLVCSCCAGEFCSRCKGKDGMRGVPWHKGLSCAQFEAVQRDGGEDLLNHYLQGTGGRACPSCHNFVIRSLGCDHMTCVCGREFCYVCGARSTRPCCQQPCPGGSL